MPVFQPFLMERFMSKYEQEVDYNLSESGVHPMTLRELVELDPAMNDKLLTTEINYPHANGIPELRENIADMYHGAAAENVLVTVGAIEANFNTIRTLLKTGEEIVVMLPNYMQIWGVAKNHGYQVKTFSLREDKDWTPDLDELEDVVSESTKLIAVCNPNNPTGYVLSEAEMNAIIRMAEKAGAWILADEVYAGGEQFTDEVTPSFYGKYDRVIAVGSMSKAYGLPGLRIGWLVGSPEVVDAIWVRHEYTTISASMLSNKLAALALSEKVLPLIRQRARDYIRKGFPVLQDWMDKHPGVFTCIPPQAAAIAFVKYNMNIKSTGFTERLVHEKSVLIIPGDHFGMDRFLRISFGLPKEYVLGGLARIHELINEIQ
jgi:aspartate/methionine/tyrosine aminotransferase